MAERGQAQIELVAGVPVLLLAGLLALQLLGAGYAQSLADGAAEAGAIAAADGRNPEQAATDGVPGWAARDVDVTVDDGLVEVEIEPAALLPGLSGALRVSSHAYARPDG